MHRQEGQRTSVHATFKRRRPGSGLRLRRPGLASPQRADAGADLEDPGPLYRLTIPAHKLADAALLPELGERGEGEGTGERIALHILVKEYTSGTPTPTAYARLCATACRRLRT